LNAWITGGVVSTNGVTVIVNETDGETFPAGSEAEHVAVRVPTENTSLIEPDGNVLPAVPPQLQEMAIALESSSGSVAVTVMVAVTQSGDVAATVTSAGWAIVGAVESAARASAVPGDSNTPALTQADANTSQVRALELPTPTSKYQTAWRSCPPTWQPGVHARPCWTDLQLAPKEKAPYAALLQAL
jgi:hypothetical protein